MSNIINTEEQVVIWRPRVEITQSEQQYEKKKINQDSRRDPWDSIKYSNICTVGIPEGKVREKGRKNI